MPFAAITIDVDALRFYGRIHGTHGEGAAAADPIFSIALPRFFELIDAMKRPATMFVIGEDALAHGAAFGPARALGCEIGSHSFRHDYSLSRLSPELIEEDLAAAEAALAPLCVDGKVRGFRAPGYNVTPALLELVVKRGYRYDSSLLPSPLYFAARAAAIGRYALTGRSSASLVGDVRAFSGSLEPYRTAPSHVYRADPQGPLLELPIACAPFSRVPIFGTSWTTLPERALDLMLGSALARLPLFNFEMHAIDLLDRSDPGVPPEVATSQLDLRVPVREKMRRFSALFRRLADNCEVLPLASYAEHHLRGS